MPALFARAVREVFRRELLPARALWWLAAEGMCDWYALLRAELAPHLGGDHAARDRLAAASAPLFERRYDLLRETHPSLPDRARDPSAVGALMGGLYRVANQSPDPRWIFDRVGSAPRAVREHARAEALMAPLDPRARWIELTSHLGELLVAVTERLADVPRIRPVLGDACFRSGERFARKMARAFALPRAPESAIEALRMSEYLFRVNPVHWSDADAAAHTGMIEGTACPWYTAPGWNGAHCGIFGQFQAGVSSVFGLRYHLARTIPKHGGTTCRVDLSPTERPPLVALRTPSRAAVTAGVPS